METVRLYRMDKQRCVTSLHHLPTKRSKTVDGLAVYDFDSVTSEKFGFFDIADFDHHVVSRHLIEGRK
jgi:hypothetical protein